MKITMHTELNQNQNGSHNQNKLQVPLNIKALDFSKATAYDKYITIPYQDPEMLHDENIQAIVTHIAEQTDWVYPDYNATKFNLVVEINEDFEIISTALQIIAQPPKYTDEQKADILKRETDDEMFETWQEIFYHADDFYKNEDKHFDNSYEEMEIKLNGDILNKLANIVTPCFQL